MIDKRIFYCWFGGGEKSELNKRCIASWEKMCPDYEIIEINESNFDINCHVISKEAYHNKNWAYVSDVARMETLANNNGFYLDTDVELYQPLDELRTKPPLVAEAGFGFYGTGILSSKGELPEVYKKAYDKISLSSPVHINLNNYIYQNYNVLANDYEQVGDIFIIGIGHIGNRRSKGIIGTHWEENTWVNGWTGEFVPFVDFVPFDIYVEGERDYKTEKKWYHGSSPIGAMIVKKTNLPLSVDIIELGNIFNNKNVTKLECEEFEFLRYNAVGNKTKNIRNGMIVTYEDSN